MCTKEKIAKIIAKIRTVYPKSYPADTPDDDKILLEGFYEFLEPYPDEMIDMSLKFAFKASGHYAPSIGDILIAIKKIEEASCPSESQLWCQLDESLKMAYNQKHYLDIDSTRDRATDRINQIWDKLNPILKTYLGSFGRFYQLSDRHFDDMEFERNRFLKAITDIREREEISGGSFIDSGPRGLKQILRSSYDELSDL